MKASTHKQSHYFEALNLFAVVIIIVTSIVLQEQMNSAIVTLFAILYFVANIAYSATTHNLDIARVVEVATIALLCEFLILNYVI